MFALPLEGGSEEEKGSVLPSEEVGFSFSRANLFKTLLLAATLVAEAAGALLRSDSGILARGIFLSQQRCRQFVQLKDLK